MSHCEWAVCGYEGFFGVGFIVVCRYSSVCNQINVHTRGCRKAVKSGWDVVRPCSETYLCNTTYCYSTYQHERITSRSYQLLMMGIWLPETC